MAKTLKDYLFLGGVKGRYFLATKECGDKNSPYQITEIYRPICKNNNVTRMDVKFIGREKDGNDYVMDLHIHLDDQELTEEEASLFTKTTS